MWDLQNLQPAAEAEADFCASMNYAEAGDGVDLATMTFGTSVAFDTPPLECAYLVTVPLSGEIAVATAAGAVTATPTRAVVCNPPDATAQRWSADAHALWVRLHADVVITEARYVERSRRGDLALPPPRHISCAPAMELSHGAGKVWLQHTLDVCDLLDAAPHGRDGRPDTARLPEHRLRSARRRLIELFLRACSPVTGSRCT